MTDLNKIAHLRFAVAKKRGYPSWSDMYDWYSREGERPEVVAQLIEAACEEVLEAYISGLQDSGMVKALEAQAEYIQFLDSAYSDAFSIASAHHYREPQERINKGIELRNRITKALAGINETKET